MRAIGSIYYLACAGTHGTFRDMDSLWAIGAFTILVSTLVHGLTAGAAVERATGTAQ